MVYMGVRSDTVGILKTLRHSTVKGKVNVTTTIGDIMKTIIDYLDDLKEKNGSDYRTAKLLNIDKSVISNIRRRQLMSDETAIMVADLLGIERDQVLIAAAIARSDGEVKKSWENISKHMGIAASITLASALMLGNSSHGTDFDLIHSTTKSVYYVKLML
jgi:hypothetical protein